MGTWFLRPIPFAWGLRPGAPLRHPSWSAEAQSGIINLVWEDGEVTRETFSEKRLTCVPGLV